METTAPVFIGSGEKIGKKEYIFNELGFSEADATGGCDLQILCDAVCGVNVGVGYHRVHRPGETLVLSEWEQTLERLRIFLEKEHPRFTIPMGKRVVRYLRIFKSLLGRILRKLGLRK